MTFASPSNDGNITGGKIIFDGTEKQQTVDAQVFNCEVTNPEGITGNLHVYGEFNLRLRPFDGTIYAHEGATFVYGSDYNKVVINEPFTLRSNVIADFDIYGTNAKLTVKNGSAYSIYGNISVSGGNSNNLPAVYIEPAASLYISKNASVTSYGILENLGTINIGGNTQVNYSGVFKNNGTAYLNGDFKTNASDSKIIQEVNKANLLIKGNISLVNKINCVLDSGKVTFFGNEVQYVNGFNASTIVIDKNSTGTVYFQNDINPSVLFNHKGNSFIVTTNSTFADFDYDGITDEADPHPTDLDLAKFVDACDVNDDGIIDILDLVLLKKELIKATEEIDKNFDIDNDGLANAIDL